MKKILSVTFAIVLFITGCQWGQREQQKEDTPALLNDDSQTLSTPVLQDNSLKQWGQGNNTDNENRPVSCIEYQEKYGDLGAEFINLNAQNEIMLTFDEGYENGYTQDILNTLEEKKVTAVFFITGDYLKRSKDLVVQMKEKGQVIGNHTQNHPSMPSLTEDKMKDEITALDQSVSEQIGVKMNLFRPPKGEFSQKSLAVTKECGYTSVFWSFAYEDWNTDKQMDKDKARDTLDKKLHNGAIYLLHAVSKTNAEILGQFIDDARSKGYEFTVFYGE